MLFRGQAVSFTPGGTGDVTGWKDHQSESAESAEWTSKLQNRSAATPRSQTACPGITVFGSGLMWNGSNQYGV